MVEEAPHRRRADVGPISDLPIRQVLFFGSSFHELDEFLKTLTSANGAPLGTYQVKQLSPAGIEEPTPASPPDLDHEGAAVVAGKFLGRLFPRRPQPTEKGRYPVEDIVRTKGHVLS